MKRILIFQHVAYEILGTFHPLLKEAGFRLRYVNYSREGYPSPAMERYDGLIVLGGPMGVYESELFPHLYEEKDHIRAMIDQGKPVLGICLGAQLIAAALGSDVFPHRAKEIGWSDVTLTPRGRQNALFDSFEDTEKLFQWHGDTFALPEGAELLASTPACRNQAFRYGDNVYGFQFHMEVDEPMIERWIKIHCRDEGIGSGEGDALSEHIRAGTRTHIKRLKSLSIKTFNEYIRLFG